MYGKPRKLKLSLMEREILWALEEDRQDVPLFLLTLAMRFEEPDSDVFREKVKNAVRRLREFGFLGLEFDTGDDRVKFPQRWVPADFDKIYGVIDDVRWSAARASGDFLHSVYLTDTGRKALWSGFQN